MWNVIPTNDYKLTLKIFAYLIFDLLHYTILYEVIEIALHYDHLIVNKTFSTD